MAFSIKTQEGTYDIEAYVRFIGDSMLVAIWGGEKPHIGAVAVAQSRPSLEDPFITSATASVICLQGHKEDDLAKAGAEILAAALDTEVVVTAGMHWDDIDADGIQKVIKNVEKLLDMILDRVGQGGGQCQNE